MCEETVLGKKLQKKRTVIIYLNHPFINLFLVINCMHRQLKMGYVRFGSGEKGNSYPGVDIIFCGSISTHIFPLVQGLTLLRDDACDD